MDEILSFLNVLLREKSPQSSFYVAIFNQSVILFLTYIFPHALSAHFPLSSTIDLLGAILSTFILWPRNTWLKHSGDFSSAGYVIMSFYAALYGLNFPTPLFIIPTAKLRTFFNFLSIFYLTTGHGCKFHSIYGLRMRFSQLFLCTGQDSRVSPRIILSRLKYLVS